MTIVKFIQQRYTDFVEAETGLSELSNQVQWEWYKAYLLRTEPMQFETKKEFREYEMQPGDQVVLVGNLEVYGAASYLTLQDVGNVSGVGPALLKNMKEILGESFTEKQLRDNAKSIKGLGASTLEKILM